MGCDCNLSGIAKRQATWMLGGEESGRKIASELLTSLGNIVDMGEDVGAANVVKLCGNFLIAVRTLFWCLWL
jgi:3-hydroxyisobutyrate dehydrogenase-like beta-hydroxyacid dehydrogenase